jgi:hypothetical protein
MHVHPEDYERAMVVLGVDQAVRPVADFRLDIRRRFAAKG